MHIVLLNSYDASEKSYQDALTASGLPTFQDTEAVKAWASVDGGKDDFFIYNSSGKLEHFLEFGGAVDTNLSGSNGYEAVKKLMLSAP